MVVSLLYCKLVAVLLANQCMFVAASASDYVVEHKLSENADFSNRGTLQCSSLSNKLQCSVYNNDDLTNIFNSLSGEGFYYLRVCDKDRKCVQTFIKQCLLVEGKFTETLEVATSPTHNIIGVSILTPIPFCNGTSSAGQSSFSVNTKVEVVDPLPPAEPETSLHIKRMEEEKRRKLTGDGEDNRSFIAKYWMYIVPVLILFMLTSQGDQGGE